MGGSLEEGEFGVPDITVEPSPGVVGLHQKNTDNGRSLPDDHCEELVA